MGGIGQQEDSDLQKLVQSDIQFILYPSWKSLQFDE